MTAAKALADLQQMLAAMAAAVADLQAQQVVERPATSGPANLSPAIPIDVDLWDVATIALYMKRTPTFIRESIVVLPSFPPIIRLPSTTGRSRPLWRAREVVTWAEKHVEKKSA